MGSRQVHEHECDICARVERSRTGERPQGWERLRIPVSKTRKRPKKGQKTLYMGIAQALACSACVQALWTWADTRRHRMKVRVKKVAEPPELT